MEQLLSSLTHPGVRRTVGWACVVAALVGIAIAVFAVAANPVVASDRYSSPLSAGAFVVSEVILAVQHLPLLVALLALAGFAPRRVARRGLEVASAGMAMLTLAELAAIGGAHAKTGSDVAAVVDTFYGVASTVIGLALIVAGVSLVRARWQVPLWLRWLPLATGSYVFVVITPATGSSDDALHWALVGWMVLFLLLGAALISPILETTRERPLRVPVPDVPTA